MMMRIALVALMALSLMTTAAWAQEVDGDGAETLLLSIDEDLFATIGRRASDDSYGEATRYYTTPIYVKRRGLDWWTLRDLNDRFILPEDDFETPQVKGRVRLSASTELYRYGLLAEYATPITRGWYASAKIDLRMGRDMAIDGVFSEDFNSEIALSKEFSRGGNISISFDMPLRTRGLRSTTTMETTTLTSNNLYNPSWGLYQGEVRNSRVSKNRMKELQMEYNKRLSHTTKLSIGIESNYGRRSVSRLGWYDAYNPSPDYYRKLPSYLAEGDLKSSVEALWRDNDTEYTQIAWDNLVVMNQQSSNGDARYIIEDQVTREASAKIQALFRQTISHKLTVNYGGSYMATGDRLFKECDDLLGAEYHLDIDQYIGDYASLGNDMQNNLRDPDRKVGEGDRFGYDYTRHERQYEAMFGLEYHDQGFIANFNGRFGDSHKWREGHYEKERFSGSDSYGDSQRVVSSISAVDMMCGYTFAGRHSISLQGAISRLPQDHQDLFLDEDSANRLVDNIDPKKFGVASLSYNFRSRDVRLNIEGYYQRLSNQTDVWSGYDDISYTYTDIVVSGISTRSIGVETDCSYRVNKAVNLNMALTFADHTYDSTPLVKLYSNDDMELLSESESTYTKGCKVGNAPQFIVSGGVDVTLSYGFRLTMNCSYATGRYIAPSFARRTERIIRAAGSYELAQQLITQSRLGGALDLSGGVMRSFEMRRGERLTLYLRVENLLCDRDRIDYGRESSRILRGAEYSTTSSYYAEADEFIFTSPRTLYISCSYNF